MQNTDKIHIQHLAAICAAKGMENVVLSPGSRCAPLVIAFNRQENIKCYSIVDERSAAFFALGLAQQSQKPVGLICTSGSAVLNYAPAVAEAFYQKIPLVLLTADRPNEWIDQGENQSIQQFEVFKNYIKKSYQLPVNVVEKEDLWFSDRMISEALNTAIYPDLAPVHINIPLREPLYNTAEQQTNHIKVVQAVKSTLLVAEEELNELQAIWTSSSKKMIIIGGQKQNNTAIDAILEQLNKREDVVILQESISNCKVKNTFAQIDPLIEWIQQQKNTNFTPELVITFGAGVVSKKLKFWLRKSNVKEHWHINKSFEHWDNFQALSRVIQADVAPFLEAIDLPMDKPANYHQLWENLQQKIQSFSDHYIQKLPYCDFKVFAHLAKTFPSNANVHFGNSTPVRYANLLPLDNSLQINANRGVSGIDGQISTALGAANYHQKTTICITGDLAMMYDSNALWNNYLKKHFKIILINNNGGNIFKIIPGPSQLEELETYFETKNQYEASHLASLHNLDYFCATSFEELEEKLAQFYQENQQAALLEIKTDGNISADALKKYFNQIKSL